MRQSAARARHDPLEDIRTSVLLDTLGLAATILALKLKYG